MNPETFRKAINACIQIGEKFPLLFVVQSGRFYIGTTGSQTSILVEGPADLPDLDVTLPFEHVQQIYKSLKSKGEVEVAEWTTSSLTLKQGKSKATYTTTKDVEVTPALLTHFYKDAFFGEFNTEDLRRALSRVSPFAGSAFVAKIQGVHLTLDKDETTVMATNNFCLAQSKFTPVTVLDDTLGGTYILPKVIFRLDKFFGPTVKIGTNKKRMVLRSEDDDIIYKITVATIDDTPLPYKALIDNYNAQTNLDSFGVETKALVESLRVSSYFTDSELHNKIKMVYKDNELQFSIADNLKGEAEEYLNTADMKGEGELFISADFMSRAAGIFKEEVVIKLDAKFVEFQDSDTDVLIASIKK